MKKIFSITFLWLLISLNTFASVPTVAPSNAVFTNVTPNSMRLGWTNGNGGRRIVIASKNATPTAVLTSSDYATVGNANLFQSPSLGNGKVVFNGTGRAVVLTNMDGGSTYYFHIYEYNITSGVYYVNTANPSALRLSASQETPPAVPTIQPSNPVFTNVTYQALTLSWTQGNGTMRLVIASKDNAPNTLPDYWDFSKAPSSTFGSGTAIGNGFIVYNGSANTVSLTNLSASSQYYFHVYEYNILNNEFYYDTDVRLAANTSTIALTAPTVIPSGEVWLLHAYAPSTNINGTYTNAGNGNGRMVVSRLSSDPISVPSNNTIYSVFDANATPVVNAKVGNSFVRNILNSGSRSLSLPNLIAGANYCVDVFEFNGDIAAGTAVFNTTPFTHCLTIPERFSPTTGATNPVFSNITTNSMKLSWTNGSGNKRMVVARKDSLPRAINTADFNTLNSQRTYNANAAYGSGSSLGEGFVVYNGTENNVSLTNLDPNGNYFFHVYEMNEFYNELIYTYYAVNNRLSANATATPVVLTPTVASSNVSFTTVTSNTLTLNWTKGNGTHRIVIAKKGSAPSADPSNGQSYTANGTFGSGSALGDGFVVYNGDGNTINITGLEAGSAYYFTIIEYNLGTGTINYANGLKLGTNWKTSESDIDNDGVIDAEDEYPQNQHMAFNTNYPAAGFGTLMFEDLWPGKGDYDFNDLVLNYRYNVISNAAGNVVEVKYTFVTRAIGGSLNNGFAFQLDGIPANRIASVSGAKTNGITYATFSNNGTESNQTFANIIVFKNAYDLLKQTGGVSFINVGADAPNVGTDTTVVTVKFLEDGISPVEEFTAIEDFTHAKFNPYLIVGQTRGKEVHLPNRVPSSLVNAQLFGTQQDNSIPTEGIYYKTEAGLPWALEVTESIPYATEKTDFTEAFLNFISWATSGGKNFTDWYLDLPSYRNNTKIYSK
jgi:LruC domain-containing protein